MSPKLREPASAELGSGHLMPESTQSHPSPDDAALLAGAEVEKPSYASPAVAHRTKTLDDVDPKQGVSGEYP
ncbi:MAG: hypothetical protein JWO63_1133, partial [Frankiales bacterium]|nr:hypothetical protein [Frankiales bacterium]